MPKTPGFMRYALYIRPRRKGGFLLGDPQGVEGVGAGLGTSVTASRMTDAYGAGTLRVPPGCAPPWYMITLKLKYVTPAHRGVRCRLFYLSL